MWLSKLNATPSFGKVNATSFLSTLAFTLEIEALLVLCFSVSVMGFPAGTISNYVI